MQKKKEKQNHISNQNAANFCLLLLTLALALPLFLPLSHSLSCTLSLSLYVILSLSTAICACSLFLFSDLAQSYLTLCGARDFSDLFLFRCFLINAKCIQNTQEPAALEVCACVCVCKCWGRVCVLAAAALLRAAEVAAEEAQLKSSMRVRK